MSRKFKIIILLFCFVVFTPAFSLSQINFSSTVKIGQGTVNGPTGLEAGDLYGRTVSALGDLNLDGVEDLVVGTQGDELGAALDAGAIHIHFMNTDGSIDSTIKIGEGTVNGPTGIGASDGYGSAVANIGDLNGDGVTDLAVAAVLDEDGATPNTGVVFIHFMNTDGTIDSTVKISESTVNGPIGLSDSDLYGSSIASIGDLNGDGVQDLLVGAFRDEAGATVDTGAAYIHFMNIDGSIDSTLKIGEGTLNGPTLEASDAYGSSVATIGDLNADGVQDLAVGAFIDENGAAANAGAVFIHFMNTDGTIDSTVKIGEGTLNGPTLSADDGYGVAVKSFGDLNADGVRDLLVGAFRGELGTTLSTGVFYVHYMNTDGTIDSTSIIGEGTLNGPTGLDLNDLYGTGFDLIGDLNDDGLQDYVVTAEMDENGATPDVGVIFIHYVGVGVSGNIFADLDSDGIDDGAGEPGIANVTVRAWHDVDNDGVIDTDTDQVVAGATTDSNGNYVIYVTGNNDYLIDVYDANNALNGRYNRLTTTNEPQDRTVVVSAIVANAIGYGQSETNDGKISSTVKIGEGTANGPTGLDASDLYGRAVASIGDLNGDGVQDLVVGSFADENGPTNDTGAIFIHFMNTDGTIDSTVKIGEGTLNGPTGLDTSDFYGVSVASLGDLNGDGVQDLVVGSVRDETGPTNGTGTIFIHFMNTDGTIDSTIKIGESTPNGPTGLIGGDLYGSAVTSIGDLNLDGVQDIVVGASRDENGAAADGGAIFIHFMNTDGTIDSTVKIGEGTANGPTGLDAGDQYGVSVTSIGDLNGDDVQDLVVGAFVDENGAAADGGAIFIHFMNTDGTIDSTVKIGEGTTNGPTGLDAGDFYGVSVASLGDLNGDGVLDLFVGAILDENGVTVDTGASYIHFMNIDGTIDSTVKIGEGTANGPLGLDGSDIYGGSVAVIGDLNGDGLQDIAIGARSDETGAAADAGAIFIHFLSSDADSDGIINSTECPGTLDATCVDSDGDNVPDYLDTDSDNDGDSDQLEGNDDQDADGIPDRLEPDNRDTDGDGIVDELDLNADGDGLDDEDECPIATSCADADGDNIPDYLDADSDGSPTGGGDSDGDGIVDNVECPTGVICVDTDGDTIPNYTDLDSDDDGISDRDECLDGAPCPDGDDDGDEDYIDPDTFGDILPISPTFVKWNTFLNQWNFLELSADGTGTLQVQIKLYNLSGALMLTRNVTVQGNNQIDVDVHNLVKTACDTENPASCNGLVDLDGNGIVDSYGLIGMTYTGTPRLVGRLTNYKINNDNSTFSFAFARELRSSSTGNTYAVANTFDPQSSGFIVPNFGELIHLGDSDDAIAGNPVANGGYTINIYDIAGVLIQTRHLVLGSLQEHDFATGHEFLDNNGSVIQSVYLVEVVPDDPSSEYLFSVARYSSNSLPGQPSDIYNYAMAVPSRRGTADPLYATISNEVTSCGSVTNWVEVGNVTSSPVFVTVRFRNSSGQTVSTSTDRIVAKSQYHYNASSQLSTGGSGSVQITSTTPDSVVAQSMVYVHECDANRIQTAYVSVARKQGRAVQVGTLNTFIGMANAIKAVSAIGVTQNYSLDAITYDGSSFSLNRSLASSATDSINAAISLTFPNNKYGILTLATDDPGTVVSEVLRIRPVTISGQTRWDFVIPTEVK